MSNQPFQTQQFDGLVLVSLLPARLCERDVLSTSTSLRVASEPRRRIARDSITPAMVTLTDSD